MNDRHGRERLPFYVDVHGHGHGHFHLIHGYEDLVPIVKKIFLLCIIFDDVFRYIQTELNETLHHQTVFQQPVQ